MLIFVDGERETGFSDKRDRCRGIERAWNGSVRIEHDFNWMGFNVAL